MTDKFKPSNTKVLLIGEGRYQDPAIAIISLNDEVEGLVKCLKDPDIVGVPTENINILIDHTKKQMHEKLNEVIDLLEPDDLFVFYYGGHAITDLNGEIYLAALDTIPINMKETSIKLRDLFGIVQRGKAKSSIMILDCSFYGNYINRILLDSNFHREIVVISAAPKQESSSGVSFVGQLTEKFTNVLKYGIPLPRQILTIQDINSQIEIDFEKQNLQKPNFYYSKGGNIPFALNVQYRSNEDDKRSYHIDVDLHSMAVSEPKVEYETITTVTNRVLESRLHSDIYRIGDADMLGYDLYAFNLFSIMSDKQTKPPVNIGILAPWGRGKTTLMKQMQQFFIQERERRTKKSKDPAGKKITIKDVKEWINGRYLVTENKIPFPTVWFNPWNYQSSDMIWAGMANAVVEQVVAQMPNQIDRESFWFRLRLARIDKEELRRELQVRAALYILQFIIWGITILFGIILLFVNFSYALGFLGIGSIFGALSSVASHIKPKGKDVLDIFDKYTKAPQYLNKLGTFHEVQEDLKKVFDLLISRDEPLVIFVDDLDRCSPSKIVEVVEAINVFISGEYCQKTYFVLGMDAEIVAASLDVAYEKMKGKVINRETEQGSLGWYFLDKFVQLPFFVPVMNEEKKVKYLASLFSMGKTEDKNMAGHEGAKGEVKTKPPQKIAEEIMASDSVEKSQQLLKTLDADQQNDVEREILKQQVESKENNEAINQEISKYSDYLSSDPRSLKRFANLLRFYNGYQVLQMKKGQRFVSIHHLGKYVALMLKFPQFVRWLQWDTENKNGKLTSAIMKATLIDRATDELIANFQPNEYLKIWSDENYFSEHEKTIPDNLRTVIGMQSDYPWLRSQGLINILLAEKEAGAGILNALECNIW